MAFLLYASSQETDDRRPFFGRLFYCFTGEPEILDTDKEEIKMTNQTNTFDIKAYLARQKTVTVTAEAVINTRNEIKNSAKLETTQNGRMEVANVVEQALCNALGVSTIFFVNQKLDEKPVVALLDAVKTRQNFASVFTEHGMDYAFENRTAGFRVTLKLIIAKARLSTLITVELTPEQTFFSHAAMFDKLVDAQGDSNSVPVKKTDWHANAKHAINGVARETDIHESHLVGREIFRGLSSIPGREDETVAMNLLNLAQRILGVERADELLAEIKGETALGEAVRVIKDGHTNMLEARREQKGTNEQRLLIEFVRSFDPDAVPFVFFTPDGKAKSMSPDASRALAMSYEKLRIMTPSKRDAAARRMASDEERESIREQTRNAEEVLAVRAKGIAATYFMEAGDLAEVVFVALARVADADSDVFPSLLEDAYITALGMMKDTRFAKLAEESFVKKVASEETKLQFFFPSDADTVKRANICRPQYGEHVIIEKREGKYGLVMGDEQGEFFLELKNDKKYVALLQGVDKVTGRVKEWKGTSGISLHLLDLEMVSEAFTAPSERPEQERLVVTLAPSFEEALAMYGANVMVAQDYEFVYDAERDFTYGLIEGEKAFRIEGQHDLVGREFQTDQVSFWF